LPRLYKEGFRGKIYSTPPTKELAFPILNDSLNLFLEKEESAHFYTMDDLMSIMKLWETVDYHQEVKIGDFSFEFISAGHILGSASLVVKKENKKIVFSGDLGNIYSPFITEKEIPSEAHYVLLESTYGDRKHETLSKRQDVLLKYIEEVINKKSVLLIPAFALERTQELIFDLNYLVENILNKKIKVFVDSPLASKIFEVYKKYSLNNLYFKKEAIEMQKLGDNIFDFKGLKIISAFEESMEIFKTTPPKIIISAAGMSNGGRVLLHELNYLKEPENILLIVGYQAEGSLGRKLLEGEKKVKILDKEIEVKAKVAFFDGYSAHADKEELINWLSKIKNVEKVFIVQGEEKSALALSEEIKNKLKIKTHLPSLYESVLL
jgi:metallo-beta-lactamase family protein